MPDDELADDQPAFAAQKSRIDQPILELIDAYWNLVNWDFANKKRKRMLETLRAVHIYGADEDPLSRISQLYYFGTVPYGYSGRRPTCLMIRIAMSTARPQPLIFNAVCAPR